MNNEGRVMRDDGRGKKEESSFVCCLSSVVRRPSHIRLLLAVFLIGILSIFIFPHGSFAADAGRKTVFQAPLVWRAGGDAGHSFQNALLAKTVLAPDGSVTSGAFAGTCELPVPVESGGILTQVSAVWKFTGQVTLEVSVTGRPEDYVRVTNGVPVPVEKRVDGFRIKWRATLAPASLLSEVRIVYHDLSGAAGSFGSELLSGFGARKEIFLNGTPSGDLYNFPVHVIVCESSKSPDACDVKLEGGILSDFRDVRFTLADGETVVPHFLESMSGAAPDRTAAFWVKVPEIPRDGLPIYMYFGNSAAEDLSDGARVFDLFDDFSAPALDPEKWMLALADETAKAYTAGSSLILEKARLTTKSYEFSSGILEYEARIMAGGAVAGILRGSDDGASDLLAYASGPENSAHAIVKSGSVVANVPKPVLPGVFYVFRAALDESGKVTFERFSPEGGEAEARIEYDAGMKPPEPVGLSSSNQNRQMECAWIRVRPVADPPPAVDPQKTAAASAEAVALPEFMDVVTSPDGRLIVKEGASEGTYVSAPVAPGFLARIIKPSWIAELPDDPVETGDPVSVSVSTRSGGAFTTGWKNGVTRYVSKKEFEAGNLLRFKIDLSGQEDQNGTLVPALEEFRLDSYPGTIRVVLPNGTETLAPGQSFLIFWEAPGFGVKYPVEISYTTETGGEQKMIAAKTDNMGDYRWTVPDELTDQAKVKVADYYDKTIYGISDDTFSIKPGAEMSEEELAAAEEAAAGESETGVIEEEAPPVPGTRDYLLSGEGLWHVPTAWSGGRVPDLESTVTITTQVTLTVDQPIQFKKLIIGDGTGEVTSKLVLKSGIDPNSGEVVIRKGGELIQANTEAHSIKGDFTVAGGGLLTQSGNGMTKESEINFSAHNIFIQPGGAVDASAKGYGGGAKKMTGYGKSAGFFRKPAGFFKKGTAQGGRHLYDTVRFPTVMGSGGAGSDSAVGGAGGGVISLVARNEFSLSGAVSANGGDASAGRKGKQEDAGGGAGGSIYLAAYKFSGAGAAITATGGSGHESGGAGGGGIIHIKAPSGKISGTINSNGGEGLETSAGSVIIE